MSDLQKKKKMFYLICLICNAYEDNIQDVVLGHSSRQIHTLHLSANNFNYDWDYDFSLIQETIIWLSATLSLLIIAAHAFSRSLLESADFLSWLRFMPLLCIDELILEKSVVIKIVF